MSAPADRLERLSLDDGMQNRARTVQSEQNGRRYDLGGLSLAQADAARDGINSKRLRLLPVLSKAVFPEQGYIGFKVLETHELKIPTSGEQGDSSAKSVHCTCSAFVQNSFCPHLPWLYSNVQEALRLPDRGPEPLSVNHLRRRFAQLASDISEADTKPITEYINSQQLPRQSQQEIEQNVLDTLSIFDRRPELEEHSSRKKPKRENDSPEGNRSMVPEMKTCLDFTIADYFAQTTPPASSITDLVVAGDLTETIKGLARYSLTFREMLNSIIDARYRARDLVGRLRHEFEEWYLEWKKYKNDNRRTVPQNHVALFAAKVRKIIASLRRYDDGPRDIPDSYYDEAIDLAITILGKLAGAALEYSTPLFLSGAEDPDKKATYALTQHTNHDVFESHTRQPKNQMPPAADAVNRNLFTNLIVSPSQNSQRLIHEVAHLLTQWAEHLTDDHLENIRGVGAALQTVMEEDPAITRDTMRERLQPWLRLLQTQATQA